MDRGVKLVDERAPLTVKAAALLLSFGAVLDFVLRAGGVQAVEAGSFQGRWWPWPQALSLVVSLMFAWLVARLNGMAYWFTLLTTGLGLGALLVTTALAGFRRTAMTPLLTGELFRWFESALLVAIFILLVVPTSRKAAWGVFRGFSRP